MNREWHQEKTPKTVLKGIRLVVCDMDGTLLHDDKTLDPWILQTNKDKAYQFTIASGRSAVLVKNYVDELGIAIPYITSNGAELYNCTHTCLKRYDLLEDEVAYFIRLAKQMQVECYACADDKIYTIGKTELIRPFLNRFLNKLAIIEDVDSECILSDPIHKMVCMHKHIEQMEQFAKQINDACPHTACIRSEGNAFTVVHKGASKGTALKDLMKELDIKKSEVLVFGDNFNDLPMFDEAGYSVAMANAEDDIKEKATFVTKDNDQNGVSFFLSQYVE